MPGPIVRVPLADLLRVLPFKASDDVRYHLNGILVTPYEGHALLVATNGHWLAVYESAEARADKDRILELPDWFATQLRAGVDNHTADEEKDEISNITPASWLVVQDEKSRLVIAGANGGDELVKPRAPFSDGKFPDWRKVLPELSTLERGLFAPFAPRYLSRLHEAVPDEREHAVFCYQQRDNPAACAIFRFGNMPQFVVALMPRRDGDSEPTPWPQWLHKEPA